ncbi:MAG: hypothetical protein AB9921_05440 [Erysipelotrichaceae bacterium]|jgi:uncharacterized membrane protein YkvI
MDDFLSNHVKGSLRSGLILGVLLVVIKASWGIGFLAGFAASLIHFQLTSNYVSGILHLRYHKRFTTYLFFAAATMFLGVPLLIAILYPTWINVFAATAGLLFFKYRLFVKEIFFRKKEE